MIIKGCGLYNGILAFTAVLLKLPIIFMITNNKDVDGRYRQGLDLIAQKSYKYSLRSADGIICQNQYQLTTLQKSYPDKEYLHMYNPYYSDYELPKIKNRSQRKYVAWIGIFSNQKNIPALLKIVKATPEVMYQVAGKVNSTKQANAETVAAINELEIQKNVKMVGFLTRNQVIPFLSEALMLLNTSHYEGFSNTFLEAFAAGTPVVTRKAVDPDGIIENNGLGRIVKDYDDLPEAITHIVNSQEYDNLAIHCRTYLEENHGKEEIATKLINFLKLFPRG